MQSHGRQMGDDRHSSRGLPAGDMGDDRVQCPANSGRTLKVLRARTHFAHTKVVDCKKSGCCRLQSFQVCWSGSTMSLSAGNYLHLRKLVFLACWDSNNSLLLPHQFSSKGL